MISLGTAISMVVSAVGGFLVYIFGGWDVWLQFLLIVMFLDILTGILKSVYKKSEKPRVADFARLFSLKD